MENWLPVVGFEGRYEVSDLGRVRTVPHVVVYKDGRRRPVPPRVLKPWAKDSGHQMVGLGKEKRAAVHALVLAAFSGPCPDGFECLHGDGNPANNARPNLRWGTHAENMADRIRHGTSNRGERHGMSKLTREQVRSIREAAQTEAVALAKTFGVSQRTVSDLKTGKSWGWLNG